MLIPAGAINTRQYAHVKDILPTLLDAAAIKATPQAALPMSGRSFLPALLDASHADNEPLFWERMGNSAMRDGRWKLVRQFNANRTWVKDHPELSAGFGSRTGKWELYDIDADPNEIHDLATQHSERATTLVSQYEAWENSVGVVERSTIVERIAAQGLKNAK